MADLLYHELFSIVLIYITKDEACITYIAV